jgi:hypothetical protein
MTKRADAAVALVLWIDLMVAAPPVPTPSLERYSMQVGDLLPLGPPAGQAWHSTSPEVALPVQTSAGWLLRGERPGACEVTSPSAAGQTGRRLLLEVLPSQVTIAPGATARLHLPSVRAFAVASEEVLTVEQRGDEMWLRATRGGTTALNIVRADGSAIRIEILALPAVIGFTLSVDETPYTLAVPGARRVWADCQGCLRIQRPYGDTFKVSPVQVGTTMLHFELPDGGELVIRVRIATA